MDTQLNWVPVDPETKEVELLDGITILNFGPGHTFGMMGLLVSLPNTGNVILASDTINTAKNYGPSILFPGRVMILLDTTKLFSILQNLPKKSKRGYSLAMMLSSLPL